MIKDNPKILIPNFFTGLNMLVGLISIFFSINGSFVDAGWWILICMVMDKLDGSAARILNASSAFGEQFDSLSDFVSFGCAPAILVFSYFNTTFSGKIIENCFYLVAAATLYIIFCAVRLAKYNSSMAEDQVYFHGLTTTMSGGMIAAYMIFSIENEAFRILLSSDILAGVLLAQSCLMLIPFKYPKIKIPKKGGFFKYLAIAIFLFCVLMVFMRRLPWLLYLIAVVYVVIGTLMTRKIATSADTPETAEKQEN